MVKSSTAYFPSWVSLFQAFPHAISKYAIMAESPGLIQHLCSASIIRNIVSVCIASFCAVGSVSGCCLVWVCAALWCPGALQGARTCGSAPGVASALTALVGLLCASQLVQSRCHPS